MKEAIIIFVRTPTSIYRLLNQNCRRIFNILPMPSTGWGIPRVKRQTNFFFSLAYDDNNYFSVFFIFNIQTRRRLCERVRVINALVAQNGRLHKIQI